ncbi:MAG: extracellular solute-binding protein [Anaerolineae bacterium]|nr:extracellular solute-binding protein [Anaerolineae bacterium]MDW8099977.1 extracellular solute-binding protein [Anaerolineae bacterium]
MSTGNQTSVWLRKISRRELLRQLALAGLGAGAAGIMPACVPATPQVVKETVVVEKVVTPTPAPAKPVEITYWQAPIWRYGKDNKTPNAPIDEWINYSIERFEAANPDIKVHLELIPWEQWGTKVNTAFASGTLPNLLYGSPTVQWVQAGVLEPLDDYVTPEIREQWASYMLSGVTVFGRIYGIPTFANPNMYALSKTALEKYGGAEFIPTDEMRAFTIQAQEQAAAAFSDGKERFAIGIPVGDHPGALYFDFAQALLGRGVQMWDDTFERFIAHENPRSVEAMQWFVDAQNKGWIIPNLPKWSDVDTFYWTLRCAMRGQWAGIQTELETAQAAGQAVKPFEIVLVSHPYDEKLKPHLAGAHQVFGFVVGRTPEPEKRAAAFRLGNWYALDPWVGEAWLVNGFFPTSKPQVEAVKGHPFLEDPNRRWVLDVYMQRYEPEPPTSQFLPQQNPRTAKILTEQKIADYSPGSFMLRMFQNLLLGKVSPAEMMTELATKINTALGVKV